MTSYSRTVTYFSSEGRENYPEVLDLVRQRSMEGDIDALVLFSATDEGAGEAAKLVADNPEMPPLTVVTYRAEMRQYEEDDDGELIGKPIGITESGTLALEASGADLVRAAMPLSNEMLVLRYADPKLSGIRETLRMFCGGLTLVVQAVLMACDAGHIKEGQRVIAFAADTAVIATAAHTDTIFFPDVGMEVSEIVCKPGKLTISRARDEDDESAPELPLET